MAETDWGSIIGSALAGYFANRGTSGGVPNTYNVPLSPEDKYWDDQRKATYEAGGSPQMKAAGSAAQQFFAGMPTTANPTFASPIMRGQAFAGGITLPKIDLSAFNFAGRPAGTSTPSGPDRGPAGPSAPGGVTPDDRRDTRGYGYGSRTDDPFNPIGGDGPLGPNPGGLDNIPPTGSPAQSPSEFAHSVSSWWDEYRAAHPNWKAEGVGSVMQGAASFFGPLASAAVNFLRRLIGGSGNQTATTPLPPPSNTLGNVAKNAPGTRDQYGNAPTTPTSQPRGYQVDPRTGRVTHTNPDTSFAGGAQDAANEAFWRGLQGPAGSGPVPSNGASGQYGGSAGNESGADAEMPWNSWRPRV